MRIIVCLLAVFASALDASTPDPKAVYVTCTSTKGNFSLVVNPSWAPLGAARFLEMVDSGFFDRIALFRVVPGFLAQFGIPYTKTKTWPAIKDDPNVGIQDPVFQRGMVAFAGSGPNTRTTQLFIGYQDDTMSLGKSAWDNPFGIVYQGMDVVDKFYSGYGDLAAFGGSAPDPTRLANEGGAWLAREKPNLDYITSCGRTAAPRPGTVFARPSGGAGPRVVAPLPPCTPDFCGSGIGFTGKAVCLCHENCLFNPSDIPCCPSFKEVCPAQHARGPAPKASPKASPKAPKAGAKGKKGKIIGKRVVG
jgi:peptidyl-prolyl cis-trans isomerase A (cyclophilin A)